MIAMQRNSTALEGAEENPRPTLKRAPTLYAISYFKLIKGALFFFFGLLIYMKASPHISQDWVDLLNKPFFQNLRIHPENKLLQHIADQLADFTTLRVKLWGLGVMLFSLFPLVEGAGMLFRARWAGWMAIGESAFFVPIEMYELAKQFHPYMVLVMLANILIVWYLYANRERLFRHHH